MITDDSLDNFLQVRGFHFRGMVGQRFAGLRLAVALPPYFNPSRSLLLRLLYPSYASENLINSSLAPFYLLSLLLIKPAS